MLFIISDVNKIVSPLFSYGNLIENDKVYIINLCVQRGKSIARVTFSENNSLPVLSNDRSIENGSPDARKLCVPHER